MKNFKNLKIWQEGIQTVMHIYKVTNEFPKEELFNLTSQIRRSAVSIPTNIAEGAGRGSDKDFKRFLDIALGSSFELETLLIIAKNLDILHEDEFSELIIRIGEVQRMINGLQRNLKQS